MADAVVLRFVNYRDDLTNAVICEVKALDIDTTAIRKNIEARRDYLALQERDFILSNIVGPMKETLKAYDDTGEGIKRQRDALGTYKTKLDDVKTARIYNCSIRKCVRIAIAQYNITTQF